MQRHEIDIRDRLQQIDAAAGAVITTNSIRTFFTPLADQVLHADRGVLAKVIPTTACIGASGLKERQFLAERFHIECIVTTHDPKRINFSENTSIHECLLVCRRWSGGKRPPTRFVSLSRMPMALPQAREAADAIAVGSPGTWGSIQDWPAERVCSGDWTPVQWYDGTLAEAVVQLEANAYLEPVGLRFDIGPAGRRIRETYVASAPELPGGVRMFWSNSGKIRRTLRGEPEAWRSPNPRKRKLASRYWHEGSHLLVATRCNVVSGRLTAVWSPIASLGSAWCPVSVREEGVAKALAAWWNSTPVRLMLLNQGPRR